VAASQENKYSEDDVPRLMHDIHKEHGKFFGTKFVHVVCLDVEIPENSQNTKKMTRFKQNLTRAAQRDWYNDPTFIELAEKEQLDGYWFKIEPNCADGGDPRSEYHVFHIEIYSDNEDASSSSSSSSSSLIMEFSVFLHEDFVPEPPGSTDVHVVKVNADKNEIKCSLQKEWPIPMGAEPSLCPSN
jgi:hypothetical protein